MSLQPEKIRCQEEMTLRVFYCCRCKIAMDQMSCFKLRLILPALVVSSVPSCLCKDEIGGNQEVVWVKSGGVGRQDFCSDCALNCSWGIVPFSAIQKHLRPLIILIFPLVCFSLIQLITGDLLKCRMPAPPPPFFFLCPASIPDCFSAVLSDRN